MKSAKELNELATRAEIAEDAPKVTSIEELLSKAEECANKGHFEFFADVSAEENRFMQKKLKELGFTIIAQYQKNTQYYRIVFSWATLPPKKISLV